MDLLVVVAILLHLLASGLCDFTITSNSKHNQTLLDHTISSYVQGYYFVLFIGDSQTDSIVFTINVYKLNNETLVLEPFKPKNGVQFFNVPSKHIQMDVTGLNNEVYKLTVFDITTRTRYHVVLDKGDQVYEVSKFSSKSLCIANLPLTSSLIAYKELESMSHIYEVTADGQIQGFICLSGIDKNITLQCNHNDIPLTRVEAFRVEVNDNNMKAFALLSGGSPSRVYALCTFEFLTKNLPASGGRVVKANKKLVLSSTEVSSPAGIAVTPFGQDHIAFVTNTDGNVKKLYISSTGIFLINEYTAPVSDKLMSDLLLVDDRLLIVEKKNILLVDVKEVCEEHENLCACRQPKDPKCGWCLLSNRCTERLACNNGVWLAASASSDEICLDTTFNPTSVARSFPEDVIITIKERDQSLSIIRGRYKCVFGVTSLKTPARVTDRLSLECPHPSMSAVDQIFPPGRTITLPVTIEDARDDVYLPMSVPYRLVICSDITNCEECVTSHGSCTWCKNEYRCTNNSQADCPQSIDQASKSSFGDIGSCPAIKSRNVRIPTNENYDLALNIQNFPTADNLAYFCLVENGSQVIQLPASKQNQKIKCRSHKYGTSVSPSSFILGNLTVNITMGTDGDDLLASAKAELYDCTYHTVCTECMQANTNQSQAATNCVWCEKMSQCRYSRCPNPDDTKIVDRCPTLDIMDSSTNPRFAPMEGGITLTIKGKGLIVNNDISDTRIKFAGDKDCGNIKASKPGGVHTLTCTIPRMYGLSSTFLKSKLKVTINGITWEKSDYITFYNPQISSLLSVGENSNRKYGPMAGGTQLRIKGSYLTHLRHTSWRMKFVNTEDKSTKILTDCKIAKDDIECRTPPVNVLATYYIMLEFTEKNYTRENDNKWQQFKYKPDSTVQSVEPDSVIAWGNNPFYVTGTHLDSIGNPKAQFTGTRSTNCTVKSESQLKCLFPEFTSVGMHNVTLLLDGIPKNKTTLPLTVLENPVFLQFPNLTKDSSKELVLNGKNIGNLKEKSEIKIFVGDQPCTITNIEDKLVVCNPPLRKDLKLGKSEVTIYINGVERFKLGKLNYQTEKTQETLTAEMIGWIAGGGSLVVIMIVVAVLLYRRSRYHKQRYKSMVKHVDQLESNSRHEIKQAFAELQTDMSDLTSDLNVTGIPYWDYKNFTFKVLFPGQTDHPSLHKLMTKKKTAVMQALDKFEHLIYNKDFLVSFIHTLESQPTFSMQDKVQLAALLMLTLQHKMDYATLVIRELLVELIETSIRKRHVKLLLRRSESVVEKMLTHWLSLCLYKYLQDHAGTPLFMLYKAIKHQIEKGPVDALTGEARYSLSQDRLIRQTVDTQAMTLNVALSTGEEMQVKVNDCDTPTQIKEKILDLYYKNQAYSTRPLASDYNLEWCPTIVGVPISDEDLTSQTVNGWKRLNTLAHYSIPDLASMKLVPKYNGHSLHSDSFRHDSRDTDKLCSDTISTKGTPRNTLTRGTAASTSNLQDHFVHNHISLWHLTKNPSQTLPKDRQQTMMSEIFLTRLLKTKGTLQDFIDKLFQTIFSTENLPPTIKFLFDFLDSEAQRHGISDPEVVHIWKNNSLNLRFWVNIIKNPEFVFDIHKPDVVDASLSAIAQTFIDSCASSEPDFGVDAPVNKLLFAKDRPRYRKMLQGMYAEIRNQPPVSDHALHAHLSELSKMYPREFYRNSALKEMYQFAQRYQKQIVDDLDQSFPKHRNPNLTTLLREINSTLDDSSPMNHYV